MIFAYIRVSSKEQHIDRQKQAIDEYCNSAKIKIDRIFIDTASGKDFNRPYYQALKFCLRAGDTIIIKELDRLGRNMEQIKKEWHELQEHGIDIIVIDTPILNTAKKTDLEKSLISNIVFELLAYMAEKERLKMRQRQDEGIAAAKSKGKHFGRPKIKYPDNWNEVYNKWRNNEITAVKAIDLLGLSASTFYRMVKQVENR
jgi:DNA invertase Pin-like site-specific DNA recombinase